MDNPEYRAGNGDYGGVGDGGDINGGADDVE